MSASTDRRDAHGGGQAPAARPFLTRAAGGLWSPVGVVYLAMCLAGLACGLWADEIIPPKAAVRPLPLRTLSTLAAAQAAFLLMVYPLAVFWRRTQLLPQAAAPRGSDWLSAVGQLAMLLVAGVPFYVAAAFFADAVTPDVLRCVLVLVLLVPLTLSLSSWLCAGTLRRTVAAGVMLLLVLGLPAGWYIVAEILQPPWSYVLWDLGPMTFAYNNGASRLDVLLPRPTWVWVVYLGIAAAMGLVQLLAPVKQERVHE